MKEENSENRGLALHVKLILSLSAIAVVLLVTAVISILEYRSMSDHVTAQIGNSIDCINVSQKVANRPGGYTRIIKTGFRANDNAPMCFIELVDFDENMAKTAKKAKRTRRSKKSAAAVEAPAEVAAEATEAPAAE